MVYRLLVTDIDGTLVNDKGAISEVAKKALAQVRSLGTRVSLCTGRVPRACRVIFDQLDLDGFHIFSEGALVSNVDGTEEIYAKTIDRMLLKQVAKYVRAYDINTIEFFSTARHLIEPNTETWFVDIRRQFFGLEPIITDFANLWQQEGIIKGTLAIASNNEKEKRKAQDFCRHFQDKLRFSWAGTPAYPNIDFINLVDLEVSKGEALKMLASYLGISLSEVVAIGDGANDIPLLSNAGLAIAMGNAPGELKKVADSVTLDVGHSGVAKAIKEFLL